MTATDWANLVALVCFLAQTGLAYFWRWRCMQARKESALALRLYASLLQHAREQQLARVTLSAGGRPS